MKRTNLTDGTDRWFDADQATEYDEDTYWSGSNLISKSTREQFSHEKLYQTKNELWILHTWSNYQGVPETYIEIDETEAVEFFIRNEYDDETIPEKLRPRIKEYEC